MDRCEPIVDHTSPASPQSSDPSKDAAAASPPSLTVSVILTNYNHARYLDCSLGAIVQQTRPADEIIVIDDGSTDNSHEILARYVKDYPQIRLIKNEKNRGVQYSIARALGAASGTHLVWAAADDKLLPNFLEKGMAALERWPEAGMVCSRLATFDDETGEETHYTGENAHAFRFDPQATYLRPDDIMDRLDEGYLWISGNTVIVRRECLMDVGAFISKLEWHSDWFAFYAVALRYGAITIPETCAMMRVCAETYSSRGMNQKKRQLAVMSAILDVLARPEFSDLRWKFRARPCLFSPFRHAMLETLLKRPADWDLLIRLMTWATEHLSVTFGNKLARAVKS